MTATTHQEVMAALERYDTTWKDWKAKTDSDLDSLGKTLADVQLAAGRPRFGAAGGTHGEAKALHKALIEFARSGDECELKAMTAGDDSSGGYLVVPVMDQAVRQIRDQVSPLSAHVRNVPLETGGEFRMPYFRGTLDSGWVAESESRPETSTLPAGEHAIALHEVYAAPKVSQKLLDTATYDVGSILIEQIAHGLASAEAVAIHTGNGVGRPRGF
ncbi:MAG: phage major capsid protein, partial [Burkholderiaceae bacterium]|nr:phage major capsid protein [Burkholderiaceae bacterium]